MTDKQRKSLIRYVHDIAAMMGLSGWTFEFDPTPTAAHDGASIDPIFGRRHATVAFNPGFASLRPELQREIVVHEMIHAHNAGRTSLIQRALPTMLGEMGWSAFESGFRLEDELATDSLATGIAEFFPLWEG